MSIVNDTKDLNKIADEILILAKKNNPVCLWGDLGAGKTTLTKQIGEMIGLKKEIQSPTYNIIKEYQIINKNIKYDRLVHIDCYRLKNAQELVDLGYYEFLNDKKALIIIEWPKIIKEILPSKRIDVKIEIVGRESRDILVLK